MAVDGGKKDGKKRKKGARKGARANDAGTGRVTFAVPPEASTETVEELRARARRLGLTGYYRLRKADLLERLQEGEPLSRA
jgi:hypothetical protein